MSYRETIRTKNKILCVILFISIFVRCVVNAITMGVSQVIGLGVAGTVIVLILSLICWKVKNERIVMYGMVFFLSFISFACMIMFPSVTNMLMFFQAIFMIIIYEEIKPILIQCAIGMIGIIYGFVKYPEKCAEGINIDVVMMCCVYIFTGMLTFATMCYLSKKGFANLEKVNNETIKEKEKTEKILKEIKDTVEVLGKTNNDINATIHNTEDISNQISVAAEEVSNKSVSEVEATNAIRNLVSDGVEQIKSVMKACMDMTQFSNQTDVTVNTNKEFAVNLDSEMNYLESQMEVIVSEMKRLEQNSQDISNILLTLDQITTQTTLLSLNASIEAARAGEQGKGFAVVASEIRNLSDDSRLFTEQINGILQSMNEITAKLKEDVENGREKVIKCAESVSVVNDAFDSISGNTSSVLNKSKVIEKKADSLENLLNMTMKDVNEINENVESTSAAMQEVSANIMHLNDMVYNMSLGYQSINNETKKLIECSNR